jgi:hypothetical protein
VKRGFKWLGAFLLGSMAVNPCLVLELDLFSKEISTVVKHRNTIKTENHDSDGWYQPK